MTSINNRAPVLYYVKFVHNFKAVVEFKFPSQSIDAQFESKLVIFLSRMTLKFDGWPWKTIGYLFYTTSSFVHNFKTIGAFQFELQFENAQFGSKSAIFFAWPWNLMVDLENNRAPLLWRFKLCVSFCSHCWIQTGVTVQKCPIKGKTDYFFKPCDLEIWWMILKNNRAPLLSNIKLCASFHPHMWNRSEVTVWKMVKLGFDLCDLDLWPLTLIFCMDITFVNGNNSWKFHEDTMRGT